MDDRLEERIRRAYMKLVEPVAKTMADLYPSVAKEHRLSEHEVRLVFGRVLLHNAALNLAGAAGASPDRMIQLVELLQGTHEEWREDGATR